MEPARSALVLERVSKRFGRGPRAVEALREVSFDLEGGQVVGLVGPNGAGKTTLLRAIVGLVDPDSGSIRAGGHELPRDRAALQAKTGWCGSDDRTFYPRLSCRENLRLFAALHGLGHKAGDARIAALAETLGFQAQLDRPFQVCSAGERQRLALARALLHEPDLLILDEPARSLDQATREVLRRELRAFAASNGRLVLVAAHDPAFLEDLCDRLLVLDAGRVIDRAEARELTSRPPPAPVARRASWLLALLALARRDRMVFLSHRFQAGLRLSLLAAWIVTLHFISGLVDTDSPKVARWLSSDYFTYALLGMACLRISQVGLVQMASALREEQLQGTTEPLFVTGSPPILLVLGGLVWPLASELAGLLVVFGFGALWLGANLAAADVPALALAVAATVVATAVWGLLSAAFVIAFKKGDPVALLVNLVTIGLSGAFFPVEMLPGWLQPLSRILPLTWGLEAVRAAALEGAGLASPEYLRPLAGLAVLTGVLLPAALIAQRAAFRYARRAGSLGQS